MKTIRLDIDYPARALPPEGDSKMSSQELSLIVISYAVNRPNEQRQMKAKELRLWSRIQDKIMDDDGKAIAGEIELSPEQFDFLNENVNAAQYPPNFASAVTALCAYLDGIKDEKKE